MKGFHIQVGAKDITFAFSFHLNHSPVREVLSICSCRDEKLKIHCLAIKERSDTNPENWLSTADCVSNSSLQFHLE